MSISIKHACVALLSVMLLVGAASNALGQATVSTDKENYACGDTVVVTGTGWFPLEVVSLTVYADSIGTPRDVLYAVADSDGNISNSEFIIGEDDLDTAFLLRAEGQTSGLSAETTFYDGMFVRWVSVAPQSPSPVQAGGSATYEVTVGGWILCSEPWCPCISVNANLSITTPLPPGVTYSFDPASAFTGGPGCTGMSTLTLETSATTPPGLISFTVRACTDFICDLDYATGVGSLDVEVPFAFDIKPGSCPNPFNITGLRDKGGGNGKDPGKSLNKGGVLPTAIVGSESFDVTEVDVSTLLLEGIAPLRHAYEDVTTPVTVADECACTPEGPDGIVDLTLKFSCKDIAGAIADVEDGDVVPLTITGSLIDGTPFEASDCVLILSKGQDMPLVSPEDAAAQKELDLGPIAPNPFTQVTRITYWVAGGQFVKLSIYDAAGRLARRLVEGVESPGEHVIEWDAGHMPSGIYFCRLEVGNDVMVKRIRLVK